MVPKVSILIPCFDMAEWVGDAIRSALRQTYANKEIIVVDDGSHDASLDVVRSFGGAIRWEAHPHRGRNPARNRLLELGDGEWLQFLDADDILDPHKIGRQIASVTGSSDLVVSPAVDPEGRPFRAPASEDPWECLLSVQMGVTSSNLFRKTAVLGAGGWDPARVAGQEYALMQAMLRRGAGVAFVPEPLVLKRKVNPESVWRTDPARARQDSVLNLTSAFRFLRDANELTPGRRHIVGLRLFQIARWYRLRGNPYYAKVLALAREVEPSQAWTLPPLPCIHRFAHRVLGARLSHRLATRVMRSPAPPSEP